MRKTYQSIFKKLFYTHLVRTRSSLELTQAQMARRLVMDDRSYIELDHGKSSCSALTLVLFMLYCCEDPMAFLEELRSAFAKENDHAA